MPADLAALNQVVGALPSELAREVLDFALFLQSRHGKPAMHPQDATEADWYALSAESMRQFDREHPDDDWGDLRPTPGYQ